MATIAAFLEKLAFDSDFEKEYDKHERATMEGFGLTEDQIDLILRGSVKKIRDQVKTDLGREVLVFRVKMG
jgi:hypothetical protein